MAGSVLLIDDDVDVLRSIGNYFERLGYEVTRELRGRPASPPSTGSVPRS
jgi:CheY-like chemotaxis protein